MTKNRLAVFDCDGTLVDSQHSIIATMTATFKHHDLPPPEPSDVRRVIGLSLSETMAVLLPGSGPDHNQEMAETYKHLFHDKRITGDVAETLFEGARDVIEKLTHDGWLLGVATGKAMRGLKATLIPHGLLEHFITLQTADIALSKPNPDMLHRAMSETGVDAADTVMIGDTTFDMEMAQNAGTKSIGVSWGYHESDELHNAGAKHVIDDFSTLPSVLEKLTEVMR